MTPRAFQFTAVASLVALIFLCVLWESILAPLRPGGTLLTIKALPLLLPLFGILRGRVYTYQWASMLILLYFAEGVVRAWSDRNVSQWLAIAEIALSLMFFSTAICFARTKSRR